DYVLEAELQAGQHDLEVLHHPHRLTLDVVRQRPRLLAGKSRHLAGDEAPAIDLDGMAERRHGCRRAGRHEEKRSAHVFPPSSRRKRREIQTQPPNRIATPQATTAGSQRSTKLTMWALIGRSGS